MNQSLDPPSSLIPGWATAEGTREYADKMQSLTGEGHFSEFLKSRIRLSSLGFGTFPGAPSIEEDENIGNLIAEAIAGGVNVIDTSAHYRYGHALAAVGQGIAKALNSGISREALFIVSKGGFLTYRGGRPENPDQWFEQEIVQQGLGNRDDLVNQVHLLSPEYIDYQIDLSRRITGLDTLDAFLIDQPEIHIPVIGKEALNKKLLPVFEVLERAVSQNRIRCYGISTFEGFRVETDSPMFQSLTSMLGLAEKAAQSVSGQAAKHHFAIAQMPFNQAMSEGFTRFNHATGQGNVASTLQAAYQLKVFMMGSHSMLKGQLANQCADAVAQTLMVLANDAQRSLQFNRSTPGMGTSLVGIHSPSQLQDLLTVTRLPVMKRDQYLKLFQRTD